MMKQKTYKNVLIISYFFPPLGGGGVQRVLKFVKYLPSFGWKPTVLSVRTSRYPAADHSGMDEIQDSTSIYRTEDWFDRWIFYPGYQKNDSHVLLLRILKMPFLFLLPDQYIGWVYPATKKAESIIDEDQIDLIFTSGPPFSTHLIGLFLKKMTKRPWVADFRDSFASNPHIPDSFFFQLHRKVLKIYEKRIVLNSDFIIGANPIKDDLLSRYSVRLNSENIAIITNGFDEEDFKGSDSMKPEKKKFLIAYTGSFMGRQTPEYFVKAMENLITEKPEIKDDIRVRFVGHFSRKEKRLFHSHKLKGIISIKGYVSHKESIDYQLRADVLLLIVSIPSEAGGDQIYPGKIFEYLRSGRPILALVPERGIAADLIKEMNAGKAIEYKDIERISETIYDLYREWKSGGLAVPADLYKIQKFQRKNLTENLARIFDHSIGISHQ